MHADENPYPYPNPNPNPNLNPFNRRHDEALMGKPNANPNPTPNPNPYPIILTLALTLALTRRGDRLAARTARVGQAFGAEHRASSEGAGQPRHRAQPTQGAAQVAA